MRKKEKCLLLYFFIKNEKTHQKSVKKSKELNLISDVILENDFI